MVEGLEVERVVELLLAPVRMPGSWGSLSSRAGSPGSSGAGVVRAASLLLMSARSASSSVNRWMWRVRSAAMAGWLALAAWRGLAGLCGHR